MDIIFLRELKVVTLIGIYEWEKRVPQTLQLDLEIALPNSRACQSDDIKDALDYAQVAQHIQTVLSNGHFSLLETLAEHIAQIILKDFNAPWVKVSVAKLQAIRNCKHGRHQHRARASALSLHTRRICPTPSFYG